MIRFVLYEKKEKEKKKKGRKTSRHLCHFNLTVVHKCNTEILYSNFPLTHVAVNYIERIRVQNPLE